MKTKTTLGKKILSVFLAVALVIGALPLTVAAALPDNRVADPVTLDGWKDFFGPDILSTHNAGGVWTDKSVMTTPDPLHEHHSAVKLSGTENKSFLVALSAIASSSQVTGKESVPTDSLLVLDLSGSMNNNSGNNDAAEDLANAANDSIKALLEASDKNRVGVVLYSGTSSSSTNNDAAITVLPLGRYTANSNGEYLSYSESGGDEYISVASGVLIEGTPTAPAQRSKEVVGATYIQKGIYAAMQELIDTDNHTNNSGVGRMPVMILMSDGSPTLATTSFTAPGQYNLGNGSDTSAAQGFVTQLTAAYAKKTIEAFYGEDLLFYTLGFKVDEGSVAEAVLNPDTTSLEAAPVAIDEFWTTYNAAALGAEVVVEENGSWEWDWSEWEYVWVDNSKTVTKVDGLTQSYVTKYFSASTDLSAAFKDIIGETLLQSKYFPTLVAESEHLSGYVSFVDRIGKYMEVTDVKGILIHDDLFSGTDLASNFATDGSMGALGTMAQPTELGTKMLEAVKKRIGITDDDTARTLIYLAYQYGQLSYKDAENFSNYIGWYANAKGEFLGFYHEGVTTLPEAVGNAATDPAYTVKSYGYLGEVDAEHGVSKSDMMFAIVQVREDIASGEQMVSFGVPAALIPVVTYEIELDENENLVDLKVSGATAPIRLVYEVALRADIDEITIHELVDPAYIAANTENGKVNFYTNQYDVTNKTGYNTLNAYSYFNPSHQNERYYYTENAVVYADTNGTLYAGDANSAPDVNGTYYRAFNVYAKNGSLQTKTVYEKISSVSLKKAKYDSANGNWYVPANAVHTYTDGFTIYKDPDNTNTLKDATGTKGIANEPFVDTQGWEEANQPDEAAYNYYVGATLGNNGKITVDLATALKLTKDVDKVNENAPDEQFEFVITADVAAGQKYSARRINANGVASAEEVTFGADGKTIVDLKDGETLYIVGLAAGTYKVAEAVNEYYQLVSINGDNTITEISTIIADGEMATVDFVNTVRETGTLTVTKEVEHNFGADYVVPDKDYSFKVKLEGIGTANKPFRAKLSNAASETTVTTNANGEVTFTLKNKQQLEIFDIPVGTIATVTETVPAGFEATYWENGVADDGVVTITAANSVRVVNNYKNYSPADASVITIGGEKLFKNADGTDADWNGRTFTFKLEEWNGTNWTPVATATASETAKEFAFKDAFAGKTYAGAGTFYFRISEEIGTDNGVTYDRTVHAFTITVADPEMDGELDVVAVTPQRDTVHVTKTTNGWDVKADFTNTYSVSGSATVSIDINKIVNAIGSTASPEGFEFGLYDGDTLVYKSQKTTERGFARLVLTYNELQQGLHTYTLKEIAPNTAADGWKYSSTEYTVTVNVFDNGAGGIDAVIYLGSDDTGAVDSIATSFTNTYDPEDENLYDPQTSTIIIEANKTLVGRDMKDGEEFTFELTNESGTVVANGVVKGAKDGAKTPIAFTEAYADALVLDAVGKYFYNLYETTADGNGLVSDKTNYRIEVTVVDNNGKLDASYIILNHADDTVNFTNTYTAEKATHAITADKVLNGKTLLDGEFEFTLTEADKNFAPVNNGKVYTTHNNADGSIVFETLEFNKVGEHYFVLEEVKGDEAYGIKYDTAKYNVKLTVTDNKDGQLVVKEEVGGVENAPKLFTNEYDAAPTSVKIPGNKVLDGRVLDADDFTFVLYASNSSWKEGAELERVKNAKDGSFGFTKFGTYDAATNSYIFDAATTEPYYYLIKEENGGKDIGGVLHDPRTYRVKIEIVDDLLGQHYAVTHIYNEHNVPVASVEFNNQYRIVDGDEVILRGEKVLEGRELKENEFTFELFETADDYKVADGQKALQSVKNGDKGVITFEKIEYTKAGKYYYVIREVEDKSIERVTFDKTEYKIEVEVKDNLDGTATASYKLVDTEAKEITFNNVYTPKPQDIKVEIAAGKTVKNLGTEKIGAEGFEFVLEKDNDKLTAKSDKDGKIKFELDFTELDIDKTYTYSLYEVDGGKENVTYSKVKYTVTVAITLNDKNVLEAEVKVDGEDKKAEFENLYDYTPKTPEPEKDPEDDPNKDPKPDNDTVVDENPRPDYKPETDETLTPEKAPNTGDSNKAYTWLLIFILSGGAALVLFPRKKKGEVK